MRPPDQRNQRLWLRDPFLFGIALALVSTVTIILAIVGRLFGDPALIALAVVSVAPAFWLFYQRDKVEARKSPGRPRRR